MTTDIKFDKQPNGRYSASWVSESGCSVIHVQREEAGNFTISAGLGSLRPITTYKKTAYEQCDILVRLRIPKGVTVTAISTTPVTAAKILVCDED